MIDKDRSTAINVAGEKYDLILTTKATKEIAARFGGLEKLGSELLASKNEQTSLSEIGWLITLLANQSVLIHNLQNRESKRELLTEEEFELLTTPADMATYKDAITEALRKGLNRNVISYDTEKNRTAE